MTPPGAITSCFLCDAQITPVTDLLCSCHHVGVDHCGEGLAPHGFRERFLLPAGRQVAVKNFNRQRLRSHSSAEPSASLVREDGPVPMTRSSGNFLTCSRWQRGLRRCHLHPHQQGGGHQLPLCSLGPILSLDTQAGGGTGGIVQLVLLVCSGTELLLSNAAQWEAFLICVILYSLVSCAESPGGYSKPQMPRLFVLGPTVMLWHEPWAASRVFTLTPTLSTA